MDLRPVCLLNIVGLTPGLVGAHTPALARLAALHGAQPLTGVLPAVTCPAQASMLSGLAPCGHGIVGNGWLFRDTCEVRFWQQSARLVAGRPLYLEARERAAARGAQFTAAKLFWWFNQGAAVDLSLTPKPWYGADGRKVFGVHGTPAGFADEIVRKLGPFPFRGFWGPEAGLASSRWIAGAADLVLRDWRPTLSLVYLPHLDYDLQRRGRSAADLPRLLAEVDACAGVVLDAAEAIGARAVVVSEYGITDVSRPVHINRLLRERRLLAVRDGPFGEQLEPHASRAFAVADHQVAHVYVQDQAAISLVRDALQQLPGVAEVLAGSAIASAGLAHPRSGELVALAEADAWFTYYYWLDDAVAPDFARTVDIHRKPGYDPCELLWDPHACCSRLRAGLRLVQSRLGLRTLFDVVPLDAALVRGSHGLPAQDPAAGPVFITNAHAPSGDMRMTDVKDYVLAAIGLGDG